MAQLLLNKYTKVDSVKLYLIRINWANNFVKWHKTLKSKYSRKYNYKQAVCKEPKLIRD